MTEPPLTWTTHADTALAERRLERFWVERVVRDPEWTTPDTGHPGRELRFGAVPERDGRILRVVCEVSVGGVHVVTAFLDRRARRPR